MATSEKSGLSCAKFTQCVKLEEIMRGNKPRWPEEVPRQKPATFCLAGPIRAHLVMTFRGEDGAGFRVAEGVVRVHCVGFARHESAPLVVFVSRLGWLAVAPV